MRERERERREGFESEREMKVQEYYVYIQIDNGAWIGGYLRRVPLGDGVLNFEGNEKKLKEK